MKDLIAKQVIEMTTISLTNRKSTGVEVTDWDVKSTIATLATMNGIKMLDISSPSKFDNLVQEILTKI